MVLYFGDAVLQLRETSRQKRIVILSLAVPEKPKVDLGRSSGLELYVIILCLYNVE